MATLREQAASRVGRTIGGKYLLESVLGVGGMASVYLGVRADRARLAVKILHREFIREEGVKERFVREGKVAGLVDHDGRVKVVDAAVTAEGELYLVMELLEGEELELRWKRYPSRRMKPLDALWIAEAMLDVLGPFHAKGVVHRDLKPANVFITADDVVKLLDFGVAKIREPGAEQLTQAGTALGTPSYMSPEQAQAKGKSGDIDARSDIFSVGATLYALMSGNRLYHDKSDPEAFILAATQPAPSLARTAAFLPVEVIATVDRAMHWDRRKRYQSAAEMAAACRKVLDLLKGPKPCFVGGRIAGVKAPIAPAPGAPQGGLAAPPSFADPADQASQARAIAFTPEMARQARAAQKQEDKTKGRVEDLETVQEYEAGGLDVSAETISQEQLEATEEEFVKKVKGVFNSVEKLVPIMRQYGPAHPYTRRRVEPLYKACIDALRMNADGIRFSVEPFCFTYKNKPVWEPEPPNDLVPYNLCRSGVEEVQIAAGVTEREVFTFFQAILIAGEEENSATRDIAAAIWEARLEHVFCHVREDYTDADAAEQDAFFAETDDVMGMAQQDLAEVAAMAVTTDQGEFAAAVGGATALRLDAAAEKHLAGQLEHGTEGWNEAFFDVFVEAYADAVRRGDPEKLVEPLAAFARDTARYRRFTLLFQTHVLLLERLGRSPTTQRDQKLPTAITVGMFQVEVIKLLFRMAGRPDEVHAEEFAALPQGLARITALLDDSVLLDCLRIANDMPDIEPRRVLFDYIDRVGKARVNDIVAELGSLKTAVAQRILDGLARDGDPAVIEAFRPLMSGQNKVLSCEATAFVLQSPEHTAQRLLKLISQPNSPVVDAALETLIRHNVRPAGPGLVRIVQDPSFTKREPNEQKQVLGALFRLHPVRAENLSIELVNKHGMLIDEALDRRRAVAAELLGRYCNSPAAIEALDGATSRRPWNSQPLRDAAQKALTSMSERGRGGSGQVRA